MEWLTDPQVWVALVTLTLLEVVLGIDNVIFISILAGKLPREEQARARQIGLALALIMRVLLLLSLGWVMGLTEPLFSVSGYDVSGRDLILILGGLFLIGKSTHEIHDKLEGEEGHLSARVPPSLTAVIVQIMLLDVVFSLDSVITAVGMANQLGVMIAAVVIAILFMLAFSGTISDYVHRHPTVKVLALAFLILIGVNLMAEGFHREISKGYTYFAMAFSLVVEMLNQRIHRHSTPVHLHEPVLGPDTAHDRTAV
jgi:predicted tellurium resistance membrane protein TerC